MTNDYGNLELHQVLLSAMKDIDRICRENGLKYFLHAGTLLGAVNHRGFIPWDDDVDISLFPEDYKKLEEIIASEYQGKYRIQTFDNTDLYYSKLNKLLICGTEVVYQDDSCDPVFIDISVFHNAPNGKIAQWFQGKELEFWDRVISVKSGRIAPVSLAAKLILLPFSKLGKSFIGRIIDCIMSRYDKRKTKWLALMIHMLPNPYTGVSGYYNDFVPEEICRCPQNVQFEDALFMAYSNPEVDLIRRYGKDYWKPYPEEKRVSKHAIKAYRITKKD